MIKKKKKVHTLKQTLSAEALINYALALSIRATENNLSEFWIAALIHQNIIKYAAWFHHGLRPKWPPAWQRQIEP